MLFRSGFENGNAIVYKAMGYDVTSYDMIARYVIAEPVYEDAETLIVGERYSAQEIEKRKNDQKRLSAYRSLVFWAYPELRRGDRRPLPACTYLFVRACSIVWMRICGRTITTLCMLNGLLVTMTLNLIHYHNFTKYHVGVHCYTSDCL